MGLHPDGGLEQPLPEKTADFVPRATSVTKGSQESEFSEGAHRAEPAIQDFTLADARRTDAFWLMNVIFTLTWVVVFMPMVHIVPFAIDLGITPYRAAMTISVIGFAGFAGRLGIGTLSDRFG